VKGAVLPALVRCPLCQKKQLRIYHDPVFDGQWGSCRNCGFHGDMIELAGSAWKLNVRATCRRLDQAGYDLASEMPLTDAIEVYERKFIAVRETAAKFWEGCQKHFAAGVDSQLRHLQQRIGAGNSNLGQLWADHGGEVLGSCHYLEPDTVFNNRGEYRLRTGAGRAGSKYFKGRGWDNCLVVPFWRLPDRLGGFLFIGRDLDPEKDFVYIPVKEGGYGELTSNRKFDAGVGMLPSVFAKPNPKLGNTLVVTNDVLTAVRLQIRHLKSHAALLPIVCTYDNGLNIRTSDKIWSLTSRDKITFWSPRPDMQIISDACQAKARFADYDVPLTEMRGDWGVLRHHPPHEWLHIVNNHSKRWDVALRRLLTGMSEHETEEIILNLELTGPGLRDFISGSKDQLREMLNNIYTARSRARQVRYDKLTVTEEADGWHVQGAHISSASIRIEQLLQARSGRNYYRGVILFNGEEVAFTERTDSVKHNMLKWARDYLEMAGHPGMTYVNAWDTRAINIALQFHTPQVVTGVDAVGWDVDRSQFNFPKFAIKVGGEVLSDYACLFTDKGVPGRSLDPPAALSKKEIRTLGERDEETAIFWATVGCVASNVLAPAIHCDTVGLILDGAGAQTIGAAAAAALGCPEYGSTEYHMANPRRLSRLGDQVGQHHWPYILRLGKSPDLSAIESWLAADEARQAIISLPWAAARAMGIRGWNVLRYERKLGSMQLMTAAARRVLPAYLADLCSRQLFIDNVSANHTENVLRDVAGWFTEQCGGDGQAVLDSLTLLELPGKYPAYQHFLDVVFRFIHDGRIQLVRKTFENEPDGESVVYHVENEAVVWIPEDRVVDTMEKLASVPPTILAIKRDLDAAGGLIGQRTYGDKRGWLVDEAWWTREHATWKTRTAKIGGPIL